MNYFAVCISVFILLSKEASSAPLDDDAKVEAYLAKYKYIRQATTAESLDSSGKPKEEVKAMGSLVVLDPQLDRTEAIREFQNKWNLTVTGELDSATLELMSKPRCGVPDVISSEDTLPLRRTKRYALQGGKWAKTDLTYSFISYTPDLPRDQIRSSIRKAFDYWSAYTPLTFTEVNGGSDLEISFAAGNHGDGAGSAFDGRGGTLAHAYFPVNVPIGGDAHFDEDELWTVDSYTGSNLVQVATHEFGHALGLSHSENQAAVMAPFYLSYDPSFRLQDDDIRGIQAIYGAKKTPSTTTPSTATGKTTPPPSSLCNNPKFDAITRMDDEEIYAFRGSMVYKILETGIAPGFPVDINTLIPGLPSNLDAAVYFPTTGVADRTRSYFFKGDSFWRVENFKIVDGKHLINTGFPGIPNNITAAFSRITNGNIYFIKGDQYYRYVRRRGVPAGYPRPLRDWIGLPSNVENAFEYGLRNYFTSGSGYYRYNDVDDMTDPGYPLDFGELWLRCAGSAQFKSVEVGDNANQYHEASAPRLVTAGLSYSLAILLAMYFVSARLLF